LKYNLERSMKNTKLGLSCSFLVPFIKFYGKALYCFNPNINAFDEITVRGVGTFSFPKSEARIQEITFKDQLTQNNPCTIKLGKKEAVMLKCLVQNPGKLVGFGEEHLVGQAAFVGRPLPKTLDASDLPEAVAPPKVLESVGMGHLSRFSCR
jgi:hypothetical protein